MADSGLAVPVCLQHGIPLKVVSATGATGTSLSQQFVLPVDGGTYSNFLGIMATRSNAGDLTALSAQLEASYDGGTTFSLVSPIGNFVTAPVAKFEVVAGPIYRINATTLTTANSATADFWACIG